MQYGDLISVVIPTYNRERSIRRAVVGVLAQTYHNIEVIVVDDCSTDTTLDILAAIADPRLRVVPHAQNAGAGTARHTGVMAAKGDLIAFQDSDDIWLLDKLEVQMRHFVELGPDYVGLFSPEIIYGRDGEGSHKKYGPRRVACVPGPNARIESGDLSGALMRGNFITLQTLLLRKSAYLAVGGFDLRLPNNEDWDFNMRLARHGGIGFIETPQVIVFDSFDGISKNKRANAISTIMIFGKIKRHAPTAGALGPIALDISRFLVTERKPRLSRRYLRKAMALQPRRLSLYLRYGLSYLPNLYRDMILRKQASMQARQR